MPQPVEVDQIRDNILNLFVQEQTRIDARLAEIADTPTRTALRRRLRELQASINVELALLDTAAREWVSTQLPQVYRMGGMQPGLGDFSWSAPHRAAVQVLAADTYSDLLSATKYLSRDTKRFVRQATRQHVRGSIVGGDTAVQAGRDLAKVMAARFGELDLPAAVRYSDGSRHSLGQYSEMVVRTKTAESYNRGTLGQSRESGVTFMECFDGPACGLASHADTDKANGQVVPIEVAESYPLAHPNCARSWGPRPDITSAKAAKEADRFTDEERRLAAKLEDQRAEVKTVTGRLTARERQRRLAERNALARGRARRRSASRSA